MIRLQAAITKQLEERHAILELEAREVSDKLKLSQKSREDTGVQLYNLQQEFMRMSKDVELVTVELTRIEKESVHSKEALALETEKHGESENTLKAHVAKCTAT